MFKLVYQYQRSTVYGERGGCTAIGDPVRLELLSLLFHKGRSNVGDIASNFRLSRPAISHHLKVLKEAGVVDYEKVGQEGFYWLNRSHVVSRLREIADGIESFAPHVSNFCTEVERDSG
jgi:ArsR family transcriptional regulator, arsenate/arsenite/antimonite-responsive transcriptional repressor